MSDLDAALRDLVRDLVRTEVVPAVRDELRAALREYAPSEPAAEYLTVSEVRRLAKVEDDETVRGWIKTRVLAASRLPGGREYRIRRADLEALLAPNGTARSAADPAEEAARVMSLAGAKMGKKGER